MSYERLMNVQFRLCVHWDNLQPSVQIPGFLSFFILPTQYNYVMTRLSEF